MQLPDPSRRQIQAIAAPVVPLAGAGRTDISTVDVKALGAQRYLQYLQQALDRATQWVAFQPDNEDLWAAVRRTVCDFLLNEWTTGHLLGTRPEEAYFVRCDRTTMTQNDIDNGRLVCLVGVAPTRPAEFVVIRIGQWTADAKR